MTSLREYFLLDPTVTFLNHGSFGATPRPVFESYQHWQLELERDPVDFMARRCGGLLDNARSVLANFLGTSPDNIVYVVNITFAMNVVARSMKLGPYDEVLTTDQEYGSVNNMWKFHAYQRGFKYINRPVHLPLTTYEDYIESFWEGVTPRTRVILLSHINWGSAFIVPLQEICRRARAAGILTVIDGAHAPGQIPVNLEEIGADFYAGNLHKWVCAPKGSGFLYARRDSQHLLEPLVVTGSWPIPDDDAPHFVGYHQYQGTRDYAAWLAVPDAIRFQAEHNWEKVRADCHALAVDTQRRILALSDRQPLYPENPVWFSQMVTIPLPLANWSKTWGRLWTDYKIEAVYLGPDENPQTRVAIQAYNTVEDIDKYIGALQTLMADEKLAVPA